LIRVFPRDSVERRIFRPLALTYAFALVGALVFAITLVPAMCALIFKPHHATHQDPKWLGRLSARYRGALSGLLARRIAIVVAAVVLLVGGGLAATKLGTEFLPELDEGDFVIFVEI